MPWLTNLLIGLFAWSTKPPAPAPTPTPAEARNEGLVLVADGVGGFDLCGKALARAVKASGLPYTTVSVRWWHGVGRWYADLSDAANHDAHAEKLAETVRRSRDENPRRPIFLVGKSGGCAVVVKALEKLSGSGATVEKAVLLAPALSPGYDLTRAIGSVRREVVVFWSPLDVVILGAGTRIFGTSDRVWCSGAGRVGFLRPKSGVDDPARSAAYKKLRQIRWTPRMSATGYLGGHMGPDSPRFLKKYVVPLLRVDPAPER
jgi:hypothetical protein